MTADEVFEILDADGMPLPQGKPRAVIERVLSNPRLFEEVEEGLYVPKQ